MRMMKKQSVSLLALSLMAMIGLSACQKPAPAEQTVASETAATTTAPVTAEAHDHDHDDDKHEGHDHHDHDHEGHDHEGHDHHHGGEAYQCGDKKIDLLVHTHDDGEVEAHATIDGVEYDLEADKNTPNTYITDDGLNNQGMKLEINGNEARFIGADNTPLMTCQKATS